MKCMICLSLAAVSSLPSTISFSTTSTRTTSQTTRSATSTKLYSSTKQDSNSGSGGGWSIGSPSRKMEEAQHKKEIAKEALCKLLDRQQKEMQQTLDLIEDLEIDYEEFINKQQLEIEKQIFDSNFNISSLQEEVDEAPSITASIKSGFNYGYISRSEGCRYESINQEYVQDERFVDYGPPGNVFSLGSQQFMRNLRAMIGEYKDENDNPKLTDKQRELQSKLQELTLSSDAIWDRERARGEIVAPLIIKIPYFALCYLLDVVFEGRSAFSRFFLLETVARMPYFSYITMLHLYETLGFWRRSADIKRIHFAEEWNEFHHLLIMESLGGDQPYWVRFLAQHSALAYYIALCILWMISPTLSYKFSEMLETHAVDTYGQFVDENKEKLKELPPSLVAVEYYTVGVSDPMFGEYQTASVNNPNRGVRKPGTNLKSLYDVFVAIRNDEGDHVQTMNSCLDPAVATMSPALESRVLTGAALAAGAGLFFGDFYGYDLTGVSELDSVLAEDSGAIPAAINSIVGGLAGLSSGLQETVGAESIEVDDDIASSGIEDIVRSGVDGFELESFLEIIRNVVVGILEIIGHIGF